MKLARVNSCGNKTLPSAHCVRVCATYQSPSLLSTTRAYLCISGAVLACALFQGCQDAGLWDGPMRWGVPWWTRRVDDVRAWWPFM